MRLKIILILSAILLCFSCRTNGKKPAPTPEDLPDDVSLIELEVNGESILEKLDDSATYSFGEVKKYSVDVKVKSKTENAIITVGTDYIQADGKGPSFTAYISDGENVLKIVSISPKDANNRKVYTVKIIKKDTGIYQRKIYSDV